MGKLKRSDFSVNSGNKDIVKKPNNLERKKMIGNKKMIILPISLLILAGIVTFGVTEAKAQGAGNNNWETSLVQRIAQKFGLKQSDVQDVFNQVRQERIASRQSDFENRLSQLVKDGKISDAQKTAILTEEKNIQSQIQWLQNLSATDRRAKMNQLRTDIQNWEKQNNLDLRSLGVGLGFGGFRGHGMGGGMMGSFRDNDDK